MVRLENRGGQQHFVRGNFFQTDEGTTVEPVSIQGSGAISGLVRANCFIVIPDGTDEVEQGAIVDIELFDGTG
jgi:molybdopterin molybdotransferase